MSQEKLKILDMLKEGKITTEEALALLKQVQDEDEGQYNSHWHDWEYRQPNPPFRLDFSWINDLRTAVDAVEEETRNIRFPDEFMDGFVYGAEEETFTAALNKGSEIGVLMFDCKNAPMKVETYGGDEIEVTARYKRKSRWNPHLMLTEENGVISLHYDDNALYVLGIDLRVPERAHIESLRLKNKNAPISVYDVEAERIELSTKNQSIKVSNVKGGYLYCETKNAPITLDAVEANQARLMTNAAKIDVNDSNIVQLCAKTSNSPLQFGNLDCKEQDPVCSIEAITTNGQISINLPHGGRKCKLRASTTSGGIYSDLNDLEYQIHERNYVEAQTHGYEAAQSKLNLNLQTTNGGIYIRQ